MVLRLSRKQLDISNMFKQWITVKQSTFIYNKLNIKIIFFIAHNYFYFQVSFFIYINSMEIEDRKNKLKDLKTTKKQRNKSYLNNNMKMQLL